MSQGFDKITKKGDKPRPITLEKKDLFARIVSFSPKLLILILILPVLCGLICVLLPALSWLPALEKTTLNLQGFIDLWQTPGITQMAALSLATGLISTLLAFVIALMILAAFFNSVWLQRIEHLLSPILVIPHAAAAIAVGFLIAPSGMFARLISPWLTGWEMAPDGMFPHDPYGISIILGLTLKELPFLLLMALGALAQPELGKKLRQQYTVALNLGYYPITAFFKAVLPLLYPFLRLPILAVLAYASASVEMPLILGPNTPPTLAVSIIQWFNDVDLTLRIKASAGALLQLVLTAGLVAFWLGGEKTIKTIFSVSSVNGKRHYADTIWQKVTAILTVGVIGFMLLSLSGLVLWAFAGFWRFPAMLPEQFVLLHFQSAFTQMSTPLVNTLSIGAVSTAFAVFLTLLCLEAEQLSAKPLSHFTSFIIYLPLLVPSIAFLFGLVWLQQLANHQSEFFNVAFAHLLFVLPYVFLSLASSYRRLDSRLAHVAASLGAAPIKVFFQIKLPQLFTPILIAIALGLAISFGQYLPTLLAGGGRIATITTEAVTLANGASRRTSAVYAIMQMALPLIGFILAWMLPKYFFRSGAR
ncbi:MULTISPECIES: ABC transporter permease [Psychrobacter]|uniref:ABC transporter permease n=1 Tax=Psychrobacter TaxID=497 RepID=UPI000C345FC6|nr:MULTISPECIES: ABC transporter permease subunit [Psychrobacter]MBA6244523.1 ABC transporter permease subunit [Psychrobacter sp. Urea-trap-18]MBA6285540.1 ABC transporter permease subunit [Psychrobacter sp. Urea-trap-16]MBA6317771.1 ABC transporter permease subunit [Psychrobacter sp. Urea-trap-20]MBA6334494.1 ABC transporter permease subunit [Psychrobacter sp. Urea-trap-19]PKG60647.1 ABC transporter permease [Psychrobacter sp. Choline-3u-12]